MPSAASGQSQSTAQSRHRCPGAVTAFHRRAAIGSVAPRPARGWALPQAWRTNHVVFLPATAIYLAGPQSAKHLLQEPHHDRRTDCTHLLFPRPGRRRRCVQQGSAQLARLERSIDELLLSTAQVGPQRPQVLQGAAQAGTDPILRGAHSLVSSLLRAKPATSRARARGPCPNRAVRCAPSRRARRRSPRM